MKVLVFGATGSAGGSVLRACLSSPAVEEVRRGDPLSMTGGNPRDKGEDRE
jgi:uncharacterized protein YbjT (DUF2867 family)